MPTREEWTRLYRDHQAKIDRHPRRDRFSVGGPCPAWPCQRCLICVVGSHSCNETTDYDACCFCPQAIPESRISLELLIADSLSANQQKENL